MDDELDFLKKKWNSAKSENKTTSDISEILNVISKKQRSILLSHYGNTLILLLTLVMISLFFYYQTSFRELWSKVGVALMVGGLFIRILIEVFSSVKSRRIKYSDNVKESSSSALAFYNFRKRVHGTVTYVIVGAYTLGFYMLTPEFSRYIDLSWIILMDIGYIVGAFILIKVIRKGIREEMEHLSDIISINQDLT